MVTLAVGGGDSGSVAEAWNGCVWKLQRTPRFTGAEARLEAVSCEAADACVAVGSSSDSAGLQVTLAEVWNGSVWRVQPTPNPIVTSGDDVLDGVSCTAVDACTAVGYESFNSGINLSVKFAEAWNGTSWKIETTFLPFPAELSAVSCSAADACTAVGYSSGSAGIVTLAEVWNGTSWTEQSTPNPAGGQSELTGVSCTAADACVAVGYYYQGSTGFGTLVEVWNGSSWTIQSTPSPASSSFLSGVSCTTADACTAVGSVTEVWNGISWTMQTPASPAGGHSIALNGVSCTSADACTAGGFVFYEYTTSIGAEFTLAEAWNGTSWSVQHTPNPL
jgi:hypothetical protein